MLTYAQLAKLERNTRDRLVLNVYVDATQLDTVARRAWRRTLADEITATRKAVAGAPHAERNAFEKAAKLLTRQAKELSDDLDGAPGWVAFVTDEEIVYAGPTVAPPQPSLTWRRGIAAAPYLRLFDGNEGVIVAVVDTRATDLYRWNGHDVEHVGRISAHAHVGRAAQMGDAPREGFHTGTRGTALADAAQRALEVGRERMLHDVAQQLEGLARPRGWIVMAGIRATVNEALKHLGRAARKRTRYVPGLGSDATEVDIASAAAQGRRHLEQEDALSRVNELIDRAAGRGRAVLGLEATQQALSTGAAREVLVTPQFFEQRAADAEAVALAVLANGARLAEVVDDAAARLDEEAGGIAATLRFPSRSGRVARGLAGAMT